MGFCGICGKLSLLVLVIAISGPFIWKYRDQREYNFRTTADEAANGIDLSGKIIIVTGANTGIGKPTAKTLLKQGATVIMACRNIAKARTAVKDIIKDLVSSGIDRKGLSSRIDVMKLDLSSLQSVDSFTKSFKEKYDSLNYIINNAGINSPEWKPTKDGIESMFGVNHIGHYRLTMNLTPLLIKTASKKLIGRVINVSSYGVNMSPKPIIDWFNNDTLIQNKDKFHAMSLYAISKTANVLFSREYNKRYGDDVNVYSVSLHPGAIATELVRSYPWYIEYLWVNIAGSTAMLKTREQGAATSIRTISISDVEFKKNGGSYWSDCNPANNDLRFDIMADTRLQKLLWQLTDDMIDKYYGVAISS